MITAKSVLKFGLGLSIVIILNSVFLYGVQLIFNEPQYDSFCEEPRPIMEENSTEEECIAQEGKWQQYHDSEKGWCDVYAKCQGEYEEARKTYNLQTFLVMIVLGLVCVLAGYLWIKPWPIAFGFSYGGLFAFLIGVTKTWGDLHELSRLVLLLIVLGALIYIGYKKFRD